MYFSVSTHKIKHIHVHFNFSKKVNCSLKVYEIDV